MRAALCALAAIAVLLVVAPASFAIAPVGNVVATPGNGQVQLTWTNPGVGDHDHTTIYRATAKYGTYTSVGTVGSGATTYTDSTALNGTDYWYRVTAATVGNVEAPAITSGAMYEQQFPDGNFNPITLERLDSSIDETWPDTGSMNGRNRRWTGYFKADYSETYTFTIPVDDALRFWVDGALMIDAWCGCPATRTTSVALSAGWHSFRVDYENTGGGGNVQVKYQSLSQPQIVIDGAHYGLETSVPATPNNASVTVTAPNGGETITGTTTITWTKSGSVDHFEIDVSSDGGATWPTSASTSVPGASTSFAWSPPADTNSSTYRIRVRGVSNGGNPLSSDASNANFTVQTPIAPPVTNITATAGNGNVLVGWTNPVNPNFDHVQVLRSTSEADPGVVVYTSPNATVNSWTDNTVSNGTTYFYRVRSVTPFGASGPTLVPASLRRSFFRDNLNDWNGTALETSPTLTFPTYNQIDGGPTHAEAAGIITRTSWSTRWTGYMDVTSAGTWQFRADCLGNVKLVIGGTTVYDGYTGCGALVGSTNLSIGRYPVTIEMQSNGGNGWLGQAAPGGSWVVMPISQFSSEPLANATPSAATATVTSPNGGENFRTRNPVNVTWTAAGADVNAVQLWLSTDGGATYPHLIARDLPNSGSFSWTPALATNTSTARIQVRAVATNGRYVATDASNADFSVTQNGGPPAVQSVTATPAAAGQVNVAWVMPSPLGTTHHVAVYRTATEGAAPTLVYSSPGTGTTSWTDTTSVAGTTYWYSVRTVDAAGVETMATNANQMQVSYFADDSLTSRAGTGLEGTGFQRSFADTGPSSTATHGLSFYGPWSMRFSGFLDVPTSATWILAPYNGDSVHAIRLFIDDRAVVDDFTGACCDGTNYAAAYMTRGLHRFRLEIKADNSSSTQFGWYPRGQAFAHIPMSAVSVETSAQVSTTSGALTVTSPNGAETYRGPNPVPITWTSSGAEMTKVDVQLSTDGGGTYPHVLARNVPNTGSWSWLPSLGLASTNARIRIVGLLANGDIVTSDTSNGDFTIDTANGPAPVQAVTAAPNGAGSITVGWTMPAPLGSTDHVAIYRASDETSTPTLVHSTVGTGTTSWNDTGLTAGTTYWYEVRTVDASGREGVAVLPGEIDTTYFSDSALTKVEGREHETASITRSFADTGPQAPSTHGEVFFGLWGLRETGYIDIPSSDTWTFQTYHSQSRHQIRLVIDDVPLIDDWGGGCCDGGQVVSRYLIAGRHKLRSEWYGYGGATVQLYMAPRGQARPLVVSGQLARPVRASATVSDTTVTVTSPNGGETFRRVAPTTITWNSGGSSAPLATVQLSTDGGATWPHVLARQVANTGSVQWMVPPGMNTTTARVRVLLLTGTNEVLTTDASNANFTVDNAAPPPPAQSVTARNNGANTIDVSWTMPSPLGTTHHVAVYRSSSAGGEPTLVYTSPNSSTTSWTDSTVVDGTTYWYSVRTVDAAGREARQIDMGHVTGEYHLGTNFDNLQFVRDETSALQYSTDFNGPIDTTAPGPTMYGQMYGVRWTGWVYVPTDDTWVFQTYNGNSGWSRVYIDNDAKIDIWGVCCSGYQQGSGYLTAGWHKFEYRTADNNEFNSEFRMGPRGQVRNIVTAGNLGSERTARITASAAVVTVTSPNGGESWTSNADHPISWTTANAPIGSKVRLSYSTDGGVTWPVTIVRGLTSSPYSWKVPESLQTTQFRVRAELVNPAGELIASDTSNADVSVDATQLTTTITNLSATPSWQQVQLSWTNPTDPAFDHVNIYRSQDPALLGLKVQTVAAPASNWTNTGLVNGVRYYYTVRAANAADEERITLTGGGIRGYYYSDSSWSSLVGTQIDPQIWINWGGGAPPLLGAQGNNFSVKWVGYVYAPTTDHYIFEASGDDDVSFTIDDQYMGPQAGNSFGSVQLTAGWHRLAYQFHEAGGDASMVLQVHTPSTARIVVPAGRLAVESSVSAQPADVTAPVPNPVGAAVTNSPTQVTWNAYGAADSQSGLPAQPYSFDGGTTWQVGDTYSRTGLSPNTAYTQTVRVRDAAGNMTNNQVVTARTLAVDPSVSASHATSTWLGPGSTSITFSNLVPFGAGGVEYYKWAVTTTAGYSFSGSEPNWSSGNLVRPFASPGKYYLHVRSYNGDDVGGGQTVLGPFWIDSAAPTPNPATVTHTSTGSTVQFDISAVTDADSGLAPLPYSFDNGATWVASPTNTATGLANNTAVSRQVVTRDAVGNLSTMVIHAGATLPVDPSITSVPASGATWYPGGTTFTLSSGVAFGPGTLWGYRYVVTTNPGASASSSDTPWTSGSLGVPIASTGTWYVRARSFNSVGDGGTTVTLGPFNVDASAPPGVTPSAASPTNIAPVLNWTGVVDGESGLSGYRIYRSTTSGALGSLIGSRPAGSTSYTDVGVLVDDTTYWYTVQAYDIAGNEQVVGNTQIAVVYSSTPPSAASVTIAGGAGATASTSVTLTLAAVNAAQMQVSNAPDFAAAVWEPYAVSKGWTLASGDGTKTVYARFRNAGGTVAGSVSDSIVLDTTAPQGDPPGITTNVVSATQIQFTSESVSDAGAGLPAAPYSFDSGATWQAGVTWNRTGLAPNTTYTADLRTRDALGNMSGVRHATATTLASAPSITSTPLPDPGSQPRGTTFTFTNQAGWGAGGVQYYRWAWTNSATYTFTGTEAMWSSGTLPKQELAAGTYYMHVKAYNSADAGGATLDMGPYIVAPPSSQADLNVNIASTQTLACTTTDFTVALLPGDVDNAKVDCTVTSSLAGWNLQAHAGASPFFTGFVDAAAAPAAYAPPGAGTAQVAFTTTGVKSDPAFANGTLWRGFAGLTDIRIGGDTGTAAGDLVTTKVRVELGSAAGLAPGTRNQTITYTLNPGP